MSSAITREELRRMIDELPDAELEVARNALRQLIANEEDARRADYHRRLIESGLIRRTPSKPTEEEARLYREWKPVKIDGKPVSQTIIEERR